MAVAAKRRAAPPAARPEWFDDLSDAALRESAGDKVFERGLAYWKEQRVELLRDDGLIAHFEAHGSDTYDVTLGFDDPGLHSACDCPHAQDGNICKHVVAAALVWRQHLGGETPGAPPEADTGRVQRNRERLAKAARTRAAHAEALRAFLSRQSAPDLAQRLWARAQADRDLMAELKAWAAQADAAGDPKALRKAVDELLKVSSRQFLDKRDVKAWVARAGQAVALLRQALPAQGAAVRGIAESAIRRADDVQGRAPEQDGAVGEVLASFTDLLVDALKAAPPPAAWAEHLLGQLLDDGPTCWADPRLVGAAGPEVARAYSRRLAALWARAPAASREDYKDLHSLRGRLRRLMVEDLELQEDLQACFEFQTRSAVHQHEFADLVRWCEAHGRARDALQIAQAACKRFGNPPQLENLLLRAYERDGWDEEALAIRQRHFDRTPTPDRYQPLMKAGQAAGGDLAALRRKAFDTARAFEDEALKHETESLKRYNLWGRQPARNVSARVGMLMLDGALDDAIDLVQAPHVCDLEVLEALADRLDKGRDEAAFELLHRCFEARVQNGKSPYAEALRLLAKSLKRLDTPQAKAHLLSVAQTYRAKTSFIAGLSRLPLPKARGP